MHARLVSRLFSDPRYQALIRQRRVVQRKWAGLLLLLGVAVLACLTYGALANWHFYGVTGTIILFLALLRRYARQSRALFDPEEAALVREARDAKD
ncbi:MAG: hypothetical protein LBQ75_02285 [Zoogloeaceae bacterium]|jgi:hypothetical protein|nr:hypothetical protein [Zoogloeaceae bacterium]